MTENDRRLIAWAESLPYMDWPNIHPENADTEEGRKALHDIAVRMYHREEQNI